MNQKQGQEYRKQLMISVPELSQQKEQCASVRLHGSSQSQGPTEFTSTRKNLKNQALLSALEEVYLIISHYRGQLEIIFQKL